MQHAALEGCWRESATEPSGSWEELIQASRGVVLNTGIALSVVTGVQDHFQRYAEFESAWGPQEHHMPNGLHVVSDEQV
jgi:hypothetical protein